MLNLNEEWKPIPGYEKFYEASTFGRIRNARGKIMKTYKINSGYQCIKFTINNKRTAHLVHRVVAITFLGTFGNKPEVNHLDENKDNNSLLNLQWVTRSGNKQHSMATGTYDKIYTQRNALGKKHLPNASSKYHNVGWDKSRCKWTAGVYKDKKHYERKRFDTEIEAALHVNYIIDKYNFTELPKNIV